jgi:GTP cyclohydrolase I
MTPSAAAPIRLASDSQIPAVEAAREVDLARIERAVREIQLAVGEDPRREGLRDTPRRVARAYRDLLSGLSDTPERHLGRVFEHDTAGDDLVIVRGIEFSSMCEHHLMPFLGRARVAYPPDRGRVVWLSKIARAVDVLARRLHLQERLAAQNASARAAWPQWSSPCAWACRCTVLSSSTRTWSGWPCTASWCAIPGCVPERAVPRRASKRPPERSPRPG